MCFGWNIILLQELYVVLSTKLSLNLVPVNGNVKPEDIPSLNNLKKQRNPSRFIKQWSARNYFQTKPPLRNRTFAHLFFSFHYRFGIFLPPLDTYLLFGIFPTVSSPFFFRRKAFDTKNKLNINNNSNNSNN